MPSTPETLFVRMGSARIPYRVVGEGERDVVLVYGYDPGLDTQWGHPDFSDFVNRLAALGRLVVHDKRGTATRPTLEERVADTIAVMDSTGVRSGVLIGLGAGAPVVTLLAATHPERVSLLALYGMWARGNPDDPSTVTAWGGPTPSTESFGLQGGWDLTPALPSIQAPTLVIQRSSDVMVVPEHAQFVATRIEGAQYAEVAGHDHWPWVGASDIVLDEIERFITDTRPEQMGFDRVLTTIVFTDIVDAAQVPLELGGQRWHELLDAHDALVGRTLDAFRGREIATAGDGFLATFDSAARAIRWADELRRQVIPLGIELRTGVHTGEVERRAEAIGGLAVRIGQRLCGLAAPSEILASRPVVDLVAGSGIEFAQRGERDLDGVPGIWLLFRVTRC